MSRRQLGLGSPSGDNPEEQRIKHQNEQKKRKQCDPDRTTSAFGGCTSSTITISPSNPKDLHCSGIEPPAWSQHTHQQLPFHKQHSPNPQQPIIWKKDKQFTNPQQSKMKCGSGKTISDPQPSYSETAKSIPTCMYIT